MTTAAARPEFVAPPRNTRPRNRRDLILLSAAEMFSRHGYHQVGMADIAAAVNVRPSALYRHFSSKQDLLVATIEAAFLPWRTMLAALGPDDLDEAIRLMVDRGIEDRSIGSLWPREMRNLDDGNRQRLWAELSEIAYTLAELLMHRRPDLSRDEARMLAWSSLGVVNSLAFHTVQPPRQQLQDVLSVLIRRVLSTVVPPVTVTRRLTGPPLRPVSRREVLLTEANILFAVRGYDAVTLDDIGAAAGIAGPSVYNHFQSKAEILGATLVRGAEWLRIDLSKILSATSDPAEALASLVSAYVGMASSHPEMVRMHQREVLDPEIKAHRDASRAAQREYVAEWTHLLELTDPGLDQTEAQITVLAFFGMVNGVVHTPQRKRLASFEGLLGAIGRRLVLGPEEGSEAAPEQRQVVLQQQG